MSWAHAESVKLKTTPIVMKRRIRAMKALQMNKWIKGVWQGSDFGVTLLALLTSKMQRNYIMFAFNTFGDQQ
jgi:hypothetical protein